MIFVFILQINNIASAQSYLWAKGASGSAGDFGNSVTTDASGNVIVAGIFNSPSITFGTTTLTNNSLAGTSDIFIVKYDGNGNVLWAKQEGGVDFDYINGITTDTLGNIIVTGDFSSPSITFGATTLTNLSTPSYDIFIAKYDSGGNPLWAKSGGGTGSEISYSIITDAGGNIIATGGFRSPSATFGTTTLTNTGSFDDIFIVKYNSAGNFLWAKGISGTNGEYGRYVTTDVAGNIIVTGPFFSSSLTFGSTTLVNLGFSDLFVAKFDGNGNVLWAKSVGGANSDETRSVTTDLSGNIVATGFFSSTSITFGTTTLTNAGSGDMFIVKYDTNGNVLWAKSAGGAGTEDGYSASIDASGNIILTGPFSSSFVTFGTIILLNATVNYFDFFIVKYDGNGTVLWAKSAGGTNYDECLSVTTDASSNIIATGGFQSATITFGTLTLTNSGLGDFFIVKLSGVTGLPELEQKKGINIFPNPTTGKFQVESIQGGSKQIEIYSLPGVKVYSQALSKQEETLNLQLTSGIYFVKVFDGDKTITQKLVVQ